MEQLNRVTLRGCVGSIKKSEVGQTTVFRFTIATNLAYKDREGCTVIETTWSQVTAFPGNGINAALMKSLVRGDRLEVTGRLRNSRLRESDGEERTVTEIVAYRIDKISDDLAFTFEQ